ncbi:MAG TPA: O-antigen ligase family protein [Solirubrobacteraceae bacterium]|nr:O-antigen ligase family protein [Solirubrobacteraceae bacterium]
MSATPRSQAPPSPSGARAPAGRRAAGALGDAVIAAVLAAAMVAVAALASSGSDPSVPVTGGFAWSEIVALALGAGGCAAGITLAARGPLWGVWSVALFAAFTALAGLSIAWSVAPDWSWYGADQLLCCLALFAGSAALARAFPERWRALVGGVAIGTAALSGWALAAKVAPATLSPPSAHAYGRLQEPFGYWNAVGLAAAMGLPACLSAAARRQSPRALRAGAVAALALDITAVVLSYSRSAALAAAVGLVVALLLGRRRLVAGALLAVGAAGALSICAWALHEHALTGDGVPLFGQVSAGHRFAAVLAVALALTFAAGWVICLQTDRRALSPVAHRRIALALRALAALAVLAVVGGLAASRRGLTGEVSHLVDRLTSIHSTVGLSAARLTQLDSSRPLYWHEGIEVGLHHPVAGAGELAYGIARLRYTDSPQTVHQAHSWLVQTFSDLGLIGLALTLALLWAWGWAAARSLGLSRALLRSGARQRKRRTTVDPEPATGRVLSPVDRELGSAEPEVRKSAEPEVRKADGQLGTTGREVGSAGRGIRTGELEVRTAASAERADERDGLVALAAVVACFGVQSALDWTWYFLGVTLPALACAGWLAGRGPLPRPVGRRAGRGALLERPAALGAVAVICALALLGGWLMWEPLRSAQALADSYGARSYAQALADARAAATDNPLSDQPLLELAGLYEGLHDPAAARAQLLEATARQPDNPEPWLWLGSFDLRAGRLGAAASELARVLALDRSGDPMAAQAAGELARARAGVRG